MRLTTVILIASLMQVSAATFGQRITLSQKNTPLKTVLRELTRQSGYDFVYNGRVVGADQKITVTLSYAEFDEALKSVLTGLNLSFKIDGKIVSIRKMEEPSIVESIKAQFQAIDVRGKIVDEKNQPLAGASINVKGKNQGTKTDGQGNFYLANVDEKASLVISFVGFKNSEFAAKEDLGILTMLLEDNSLEQVQVIAYGEVKKKYSTSNIGSIKGEIISQQPVNNLLQALQGRVSGLFVSQSTGLPGGEVKLRVQGQNSILNGNEAFYVVDGVPITPNLAASSVNGTLPGGITSVFNFIDPSDIQSVEILKDADATAIYGSRAANGAILISTKKGRAGNTTVNFNLQKGISQVGNKLKLLNTEQYISLRRAAIKSDGLSVGPGDYDLNGVWDSSRFTDWQDELLGGNSELDNHHLSMSGGTQNTQFLISGGFIKETNIFNNDFGSSKVNLHTNLAHYAFDNKLKIDLTTSILHDNTEIGNADLTATALSLAPNAPALYNEDGSLNWQPLPNNSRSFSFQNPLGGLLRIFKGKTMVSNTSVGVSYSILPGFDARLTGGFNTINGSELNKNPQSSYSPAVTSNIRSANSANRTNSSWIVEPQLTYSKELSFGSIDALLGGTAQRTDNKLITIAGEGFSSDSQLENLQAAARYRVLLSQESRYNYSAIFGRLNYRLLDKYIVNLSLRRDGSSRFGSKNLFNNFWSIGTGWLLSEEDFFKHLKPAINFAKLRMTYGATGNDQIQDYGFYTIFDTYNVSIPYQQLVGTLPNGHSNPYLQWETTKKLNFGIDMSFLNERITFQANLYRNRSSNQLLYYLLPSFTGFASVPRNLPATIQNKGLELTLDARIINSTKFKWNTSFNFSKQTNRLIRFENLETSPYASLYKVGQPVTVDKVFDLVGVNSDNGYFDFRKEDGTITQSPDNSTDRIKDINVSPNFFGGFSNSLEGYNFTLDVHFSFVSQIVKNNDFGFTGWPGLSGYNFPVEFLDYWSNNGADAKYTKVSTEFSSLFQQYNDVRSSTASYSDASYIRLKNLSLSYNLRPILFKKSTLKSFKIYIQAQNLLTLTKFNGLDPESGSPASLPPLQAFTFGLNLTL